MMAFTVSTHSRPKAAGGSAFPKNGLCRFNTQPPEGGWPKKRRGRDWLYRCFNTQPPEGGWSTILSGGCDEEVFQHTAARRRLALIYSFATLVFDVSTHSRPKAAAQQNLHNSQWRFSFNTQPPEGGWLMKLLAPNMRNCFNTQPPEGG